MVLSPHFEGPSAISGQRYSEIPAFVLYLLEHDRLSQSALVLHLEGGGRRWRRVVRYGVLVTPLAVIEARIDRGLRGRSGRWDG